MAEKKVEKNEIVVAKNIYQKLQKVRRELIQSEIKKSGRNQFNKFDYFELKDFLPKATELFYENDLCPLFSVEIDGNGIEYAKMVIVSGMEQIPFRFPTASSNNSKNPVQNLGADLTYFRRYLYMMALDIVEKDAIDSEDQNKEKANFATKIQVDILAKNKEIIMDKFMEMGVKTINDIKALTVEQASELIKLVDERKKNGNRVPGE